MDEELSSNSLKHCVGGIMMHTQKEHTQSTLFNIGIHGVIYPVIRCTLLIFFFPPYMLISPIVFKNFKHLLTLCHCSCRSLTCFLYMINANKRKYMIFTCKPQSFVSSLPSLCVNNLPLEHVTNYKYLLGEFLHVKFLGLHTLKLCIFF